MINSNLSIMEADRSLADIVGQVHSKAWKDTYEGIFSEEYINQDSAEKRKQEFLQALENNKSKYYTVIINKCNIGVIKVTTMSYNICEIESIYFLKEYRGMGYGTKMLDFIKKEYKSCKIVLWVLDSNHDAINFYIKNSFSFNGHKRKINRGYEYYQKQYEYSN